MSEKHYIAHINKIGEEQTIRDHLYNVASLAGEFGKAFSAEEETYLAGLMHDVGKYSADFQNHIRSNNNNHVDHSTAGAVESYRLKSLASAFANAGHHAGLPDYGFRFDGNESTLRNRLNKSIPDYSAFANDIKTFNIPVKQPDNMYSFMFYVRMVFSCLVDADFLDTEKFMNGEVDRAFFDSIQQLKQRFDKEVNKLLQNPQGNINIVRSNILKRCIEAGKTTNRGFYRLSLPTGAGKTNDSMAFALNHAVANGLKRIIYVIPYTSIIDQTAKTYQEILGLNNVLEHHSDVEYSGDENDISSQKKLATENWDMPIIITTAVQFFESLYSCKVSKCRKLHNIADSVIIFDEAQTMPTYYLEPCLSAIYELEQHYKCTVILSTATQPPFETMFQRLHKSITIQDIYNLTNQEREVFHRCEILDGGEITTEKLAKEADKLNSSVLIVVNTKKTAKSIFEKTTYDRRYYLSTSLIAKDRKRIIQQIKDDLARGRKCVVVSTSLIEAGIDLDFPYVYRELAGLDSIIQAAGRCNREGKLPMNECSAYYFVLSDADTWEGVSQNIAASKISLRNNRIEAATDDYYNYLWLQLKDTDKKKIMQLSSRADIPFKEISEQFKLIDADMHTLYIPCKENENLLEAVRHGDGISKGLFRQLNQYAVNIYENELNRLRQMGAVETINDDIYILSDMELYNHDTGLSTHSNTEGYFI